MNTYAVVAVWRMDPELADAQQRGLEDRIIPFSKSQPGFVQGRWTRAPTAFATSLSSSSRPPITPGPSSTWSGPGSRPTSARRPA